MAVKTGVFLLVLVVLWGPGECREGAMCRVCQDVWVSYDAPLGKEREFAARLRRLNWEHGIWDFERYSEPCGGAKPQQCPPNNICMQVKRSITIEPGDGYGVNETLVVLTSGCVNNVTLETGDTPCVEAAAHTEDNWSHVIWHSPRVTQEVDVTCGAFGQSVDHLVHLRPLINITVPFAATDVFRPEMRLSSYLYYVPYVTNVEIIDKNERYMDRETDLTLAVWITTDRNPMETNLHAENFREHVTKALEQSAKLERPPTQCYVCHDATVIPTPVQDSDLSPDEIRKTATETVKKLDQKYTMFESSRFSLPCGGAKPQQCSDGTICTQTSSNFIIGPELTDGTMSIEVKYHVNKCENEEWPLSRDAEYEYKEDAENEEQDDDYGFAEDLYDSSGLSGYAGGYMNNDLSAYEQCSFELTFHETNMCLCDYGATRCESESFAEYLREAGTGLSSDGCEQRCCHDSSGDCGVEHIIALEPRLQFPLETSSSPETIQDRLNDALFSFPHFSSLALTGETDDCGNLEVSVQAFMMEDARETVTDRKWELFDLITKEITNLNAGRD